MISVRAENSREAFEWLQGRVGMLDMGPNSIAAVVRENGQLRAVVSITGWAGKTAAVSIACDDSCFLLTVLREAARVAFRKLQLVSVLAHVDARRHDFLRGLAGIGFLELARVRNGFDGDSDQVILELRAENSPFKPRSLLARSRQCTESPVVSTMPQAMEPTEAR